MLGEGEHDSLAAPRDRSRLGRREDGRRLRLDPAVSGERQPADGQRFDTRCRRDAVSLVEQGACGIEIALHAAQVREMVERDRKHPEGAGAAGQLNASGGQVVPTVVVEQLRRDASSEPRPADAHPLALALLPKRRECALQRGCARGVPLGEPNRQPVDEHVHGTRSIRYARCLESCARDLHRPRPEPARGACGAEGGQIRVAGKGNVKRFKLPRRVEQQRQRVGGAPQIHDLALQELQPGAIQAGSGPAAAVASSLNASSEAPAQMLAGRGFQRAMGPAGRVGRERRRSLQERSRRSESAARTGAGGGPLQLDGDVLIGPAMRARDAKPGDQDRNLDPWLPPAPDALRADHRAMPLGRRQNAEADGET